jgi:hypothetical protein
MSLPNSSDAAFYGASDNTANRTPANGADLSNQVGLDGTRAATPNTGSRYLNHVGITDSSATSGTSTDCDYITTRFNSKRDATYEVTVRDGKIYINTGNGDQVQQPQVYHPANVAEQQARENNYYAQPAPPPVEAYYPPQTYAQQYPPTESYYPPPLPMPMPYREPWGYPHRQPWGYEHQPWGYEHQHRGFNVGGAVFGALFGGIAALAGGRSYYPPPSYEGSPGYYASAPVGYSPMQANYATPNGYGYNNSGYYASRYTPTYSRGYNPGYAPASSYDAYSSNNQQNNDSFYYS